MDEHVRPLDLETEVLTIEDSVGWYVGEEVVADTDLPPFDRSAVDGYAVRASDTFGASPTNPIPLRLVRRPADAGKEALLLEPGRAMQVFTGDPLPEGSDAVVMAEDCRVEGETVWVLTQVQPWRNVSRRGEDIRKGTTVLKRGVRIRPWHVGVLASLNLTHVRVLRRLRVAVFSTGDELVERGTPLGPGKVVNSSKPMLIAMIRELGCEPVDLGTVPDDLGTIKDRVREGLRAADLVVVTGGTSVGGKDLVPEAIEMSGKVTARLHGIRIRPGKPTGIFIVDGKPVFALSGFPVAAYVGFHAFVTRAVTNMYGSRPDPPRLVRGRLTRAVPNPGSTTSFVRVRVRRSGNEYLVEPLMLTGSGVLSTLVLGNGILVVPEEVEGYHEGDEVEVELLQPVEG